MAPETIFFKQEIRQLLYGKRDHRYRVLFSVQEGLVNVLFIRHYAQDWMRPKG